jgi:seryl-tRNA synthetase
MIDVDRKIKRNYQAQKIGQLGAALANAEKAAKHYFGLVDQCNKQLQWKAKQLKQARQALKQIATALPDEDNESWSKFAARLKSIAKSYTSAKGEKP